MTTNRTLYDKRLENDTSKVKPINYTYIAGNQDDKSYTPIVTNSNNEISAALTNLEELKEALINGTIDKNVLKWLPGVSEPATQNIVDQTFLLNKIMAQEPYDINQTLIFSIEPTDNVYYKFSDIRVIFPFGYYLPTTSTNTDVAPTTTLVPFWMQRAISSIKVLNKNTNAIIFQENDNKQELIDNLKKEFRNMTTKPHLENNLPKERHPFIESNTLYSNTEIENYTRRSHNSTTASQRTNKQLTERLIVFHNYLKLLPFIQVKLSDLCHFANCDEFINERVEIQINWIRDFNEIFESNASSNDPNVSVGRLAFKEHPYMTLNYYNLSNEYDALTMKQKSLSKISYYSVFKEKVTRSANCISGSDRITIPFTNTNRSGTHYIIDVEDMKNVTHKSVYDNYSNNLASKVIKELRFTGLNRDDHPNGSLTFKFDPTDVHSQDKKIIYNSWLAYMLGNNSTLHRDDYAHLDEILNYQIEKEYFGSGLQVWESDPSNSSKIIIDMRQAKGSIEMAESSAPYCGDLHLEIIFHQPVPPSRVIRASISNLSQSYLANINNWGRKPVPPHLTYVNSERSEFLAKVTPLSIRNKGSIPTKVF